MHIADGDPFHPDSRFTCSKELSQLLGRHCEEDYAVGYACWVGRLHLEDLQATQDAFMAHLNDRTGNTPFDVEYRMMTYNGVYRAYHSTGYALRDNDGTPLRVAGAVADVTEKRQTRTLLYELTAGIERRDSLLDEQNRRFETILNLMPFPVRVADSKMNWTFVNDTAQELFGIKREDMLGKPCDHGKFCICGTDNCSLERAKRGEMQTFFEHGGRSYQVDVKTFDIAEGESPGFIEMIHDVTSVTASARLAADTEKKQVERRADSLSAQVTEKIREILSLQNAMVSTVADLVEFRDGCTGGHIARTQLYMKAMIDGLLERGLYREEVAGWNIEHVLSSAQLHDVGKIVISDTILNKPGKLTPEEFDIMKTHVRAGIDAINRILDKTAENRFLRHARNIIGAHHERWDGAGYPQGLKGAEIPLEGRIMAIADVYDALVSWRPYKGPYTHEAAARIIEEGSLTSFDPVLIEVFKNVKGQFKKILEDCTERRPA
jgi:PAS domain S-box-containing protein